MREYANLGLKLMVICLVAALALAGINSVTAPIIKEQENARVNAARLELIPDAYDFIAAEDLSFAADKYPEVTEAFTAVDASGNTIGYVMGYNAKGFGGPINMNIGILEDGTIAGMRIITHAETEGLGANATKPEYYEQYTNIADVSAVNAMSGATVTSNAVSKAVAKAQAFALEAGPVLGDPNAELAPVEEVDRGDGAGGEFTAEDFGFGGPVVVTVLFNSDGTINTVTATGDGETDGIGTNAFEADYLDLFIGTTTPTEVDTCAGATFTSTGVKNAINKCGALYCGEDPNAGAAEEEEAPAASGDAAGGEYTASAFGFGGMVEVTVTFNGDGTIANVVVDGPNETNGIGSRACQEDYLANFVGQTGPADVDALSGASLTSGAIKTAIQDCCDQFAANGGAAAAPAAGADAAGGEYTASAFGFGGMVEVTVTFNGDGTIANVVANGPNETNGIGSRACQEDYLANFVGQTGSADVDVLSGASMTSGAIKTAVQDCCDQFAAN